MKEIRIYTDGGCSGNPGPGAWAFILLAGQERLQGSGGERQTTNNRMELQAVIAALEELARHRQWQGLPIRWQWLQGHAGHPLNEECDRLVQEAIRNQPR